MRIVDAYLKLFDNLNVYWKISIQICLIVMFTFFLSKLIKHLLFAMFKYSVKTGSSVDNGVIVAIKKPILFFIWL